MEVKSKTFGEQKLDSDSIISFPNGIPGFEDQTSFQLFDLKESEIVYLLQSVNNEDVAFSVAHPSHFNINYQFILTDEEQATLQVQTVDDLLLLLILHKDNLTDVSSSPTIKGSIKSPLIINTKKRIGIQKPLAEIEQSITLTEKHHEIDVSET